MSTNTSEGKGDEVDLIDLFRRFWNSMVRFILGAGRFLLVCFFFLVKNFIPLLISVVIGLAISYALRLTTKPRYNSEITLKTNAVSNAEMIPYINKLSQLVKEKNYPALASALNLPPEPAKGIKKIRAYWIIDKNNDSIPDYVDYRNIHNVYDTINVRMKDRFVISAVVLDPSILPQIRNGIIKYTENNPYFQEKNILRLRQNDEMLSRLNYDIRELDSLQKVKYFEETRHRQTGKDGQIVFLQEQKTQLIYTDIYNLYRLKLEYDKQKYLYPGIITVISDFFSPIKRLNGGFYYSEIIVPACFLFVLIILIYARNRVKIRDIYHKYR